MNKNSPTILGIDVGGSSIKGALVNVKSGVLLAVPRKIKTPRDAGIDSISKRIKEMISLFDWDGPIGCGLPCAVKNGVVLTAYALDESWIGIQADETLSQMLRNPVTVLNDADAAGIAEIRFGMGRNIPGVIILLTIGTGLGSALFHNGCLVPNFEIGWMEIDGQHTGSYFATSAMTREELSWEQWGSRFNQVLSVLELIFRPSLFILGGGFSENIDNFLQYINLSTEVVPAKLRNDAGILGAAITASEKIG